MPTARLFFIVPEDVSRIAELLGDHGAEGCLGGLTDGEEIAEFIAPRAGDAMEVEFDAEDPMEPISELIDALQLAGMPYWGVYDAFTERSRGIRVPGRVIVSIDGTKEQRREMPFEWEKGPPALDTHTLRAAGMDEAMAEAVERRFIPHLTYGPK